jgi:iron complex outermembrane receptor protein
MCRSCAGRRHLVRRNTIGGAILLSTTDPGDEFGGTARLGTGDDSKIDAFVALDVPFSDAFKTRISAGMLKQDGYVHRSDGIDLGDKDTFTAALKAVWTPSEKVSRRVWVRLQ